MKELRFDGRTAVVTGAGGNPSLGRAHALLLAERGANVVVNDIGHLPAALGYSGEASAESVAAQIRALGGKAVADTNSVSRANRPLSRRCSTSFTSCPGVVMISPAIASAINDCPPAPARTRGSRR